jgi:hypothetical protein
MRSAMTIIGPVCLALLVSTVAPARPMGEALRGVVKVTADSEIQTIVHVQLKILTVTVGEAFPRDGRFEFRGLTPGRYTLLAEAPGYETVSRDVDVPGEWFTVLELRPERRNTAKAEVLPVWSLKIPDSARRQLAAGARLMGTDCNEAIEHMRKAVRIYAAYGDAHRAMAECYSKMNELELAVQEFKKALEQPHEPDVHLQLGNIYAKQHNAALVTYQLELFVEEVKPGPTRDSAMEILSRRRSK